MTQYTKKLFSLLMAAVMLLAVLLYLKMLKR